MGMLTRARAQGSDWCSPRRRTRAPRRAGRYYVTVGSADEPLCAADRSRAVRVRRR